MDINGGVPAAFALKSWDPTRYGSLVHPGDNYSDDIFSTRSGRRVSRVA